MIKWYRLAAQQGHPAAQGLLGKMYKLGEGVLQDDKEAVKWTRLAAEQGFASAQFSLGLMYLNGDGIPQDDVKGYIWLGYF